MQNYGTPRATVVTQVIGCLEQRLLNSISRFHRQDQQMQNASSKEPTQELPHNHGGDDSDEQAGRCLCLWHTGSDHRS